MRTASTDVERLMSDVVDIDPIEFRRALSHLPTGVTVLTAHGLNGPVGMAANSITSVSLDPPLILVCPAKSSSTWPAIRQAGSFCVNIMASHHEGLTRQFAARDTERFVGVDHSSRRTGPALSEAIAWIECVIQDEHDAGDHTIVVARVVGLDAVGESDPLVFFRGQYGSFRASDV